jgi:hypothetical protein
MVFESFNTQTIFPLFRLIQIKNTLLRMNAELSKNYGEFYQDSLLLYSEKRGTDLTANIQKYSPTSQLIEYSKSSKVDSIKEMCQSIDQEKPSAIIHLSNDPDHLFHLVTAINNFQIDKITLVQIDAQNNQAPSLAPILNSLNQLNQKLQLQIIKIITNPFFHDLNSSKPIFSKEIISENLTLDLHQYDLNFLLIQTQYFSTSITSVMEQIVPREKNRALILCLTETSDFQLSQLSFGLPYFTLLEIFHWYYQECCLYASPFIPPRLEQKYNPKQKIIGIYSPFDTIQSTTNVMSLLSSLTFKNNK